MLSKDWILFLYQPRGSGFIFFFNDTATTEIYTLSLHDALPISLRHGGLTGARVQFDISGSSLTMKHELGGQGFAIDFKVDGDRMVGRVRNTDMPLRVVLERVQPVTPTRPVAIAPRPAPPPPAPMPVAPEPPKTP